MLLSVRTRLALKNGQQKALHFHRESERRPFNRFSNAALQKNVILFNDVLFDFTFVR